ncbi:MAG: peptidyl-prolyl cis-trans isomerase [Planctomycetes bacterium]|nr:peptidyl-prolyl cis-trans isomerase [Planctomycetota bacterium]
MEPPIATVDGWPIARHRVVDLLVRSHGVGVLEQLIVLDAAERAAEEMGLAVTQADVDREYRRALERLANPVSAIAPDSFDPASAERLLEEVLSRRDISREEYLLAIRRNAVLRLIVEAELIIDSEQISAEYERLYGQRVQVRHIQLATIAEVGRVQERLAAGEEFATVAGTHSANEASAQVGGLLAPFSEHDAEVPAALRNAAFALKPGELSDAVRVGEWYHLLQLVAVLPAEDVALEQVREPVQRSLRERLAEPAMRERYDRLFREADVVIYDPVLREAFEQKHPPSAMPAQPY